jgi:hypothetical protein
MLLNEGLKKVPDNAELPSVVEPEDRREPIEQPTELIVRVSLEGSWASL